MKHPMDLLVARSVLFLDIDGVLNDHVFNAEAQSSTFCKANVECLNLILAHSKCDVVVSSAWRYMVLGGAMTLLGFEYLMRTHGCHVQGRLVGVTRKDSIVTCQLCEAHQTLPLERGNQIKEWLATNSRYTKYAILDDMNLGFEGMNFVQTEKTRGLSNTDAKLVLEMLL